MQPLSVFVSGSDGIAVQCTTAPCVRTNREDKRVTVCGVVEWRTGCRSALKRQFESNVDDQRDGASIGAGPRLETRLRPVSVRFSIRFTKSW